MQYWQTEPVWMDEQAAHMEGVSIGWPVNCTRPSLNLIKRNVPQSTVTEPSEGNVITVTVFGNKDKNTAAVRGKASVLPPVLQTPCHITARKTVSVTSKKLKITKCLWWKKITTTVSPPDWDFTLEKSLCPHEWQSQTGHDYWWRLCNSAWNP